MSVVIVNRLRFATPVDQIAPEVRERFPAAFDENEGFERFVFVRTAEDEAVVLIFWDTAEHAKAGAERLGPTVFNDVVAPHLVEQDRRAGPALIDHVTA